MSHEKSLEQSVVNIPKLSAYLKRTLSMMKRSELQIDLVLKEIAEIKKDQESRRVIDPRVAEKRLVGVQKNILALMRQGVVRRSEVSRRLGIRPGTYDQHIRRLRKKLGFSSSYSLVAYAAETRP